MKTTDKADTTTTNTLPLAVAYLRMSSDKQDMSIPDQRKKLYPWAKGRYRIVEEYVDEGKSGSKDTDKRLSFLRMMADLSHGKHAGKVRIVIAVDKSRFDRLDILDGAEFKKQLRAVKVKLDTVINGMIDWSTMMGRIMDAVISEANNQTPLIIAEKGLAGRIRVTREGRPNQTTPYAMAKLVKSPTGEEITIPRGQRFATPKTWTSKFIAGHPKEVEAVRYLYQTYATEDVSLNELSRRADKMGFPTPGTAGEWIGDTIAWMLSNPIYAGGLRIGVVPKGKFFQTRGDGIETPTADATGKPTPVMVWDTHDGIVDRKLWDAVQLKITTTKKTRRRPPRNAGPYALTKIVKCGNCGRDMYGSRNLYGKIMYRCHRGEISNKAKCGYWIAYESDLLPLIMGDFLDCIREEIVREMGRTERVTLSDDGTRLKNELAALDKKLARGNERFLEAHAAVAKGLLATLAKWQNERDELARKIEADANASKGTGGKLLDWWRTYSQEFFQSNPIDIGVKADDGSGPECIVNGHPDPFAQDPGIHAVPDGENVLVVRTKIPASVLREKLRKIGTEVTVWFNRKDKGKGYDLGKIKAKAQINGEVCYEWASNAAS